MSVQSKAYLKTRFETFDYPTQQDFVDLIDSLAGVTELAAVVGMSDYSSGKTYAEGNGCYYLGIEYRANKTTTGTFKPADWDAVGTDWANVLNKPITFTPSAHTHAISDIVGLDAEIILLQDDIDDLFTSVGSINSTLVGIVADIDRSEEHTSELQSQR